MNMLADWLASAAHIAKTVAVWYFKALAVVIAFGWFVLHVL